MHGTVDRAECVTPKICYGQPPGTQRLLYYMAIAQHFNAEHSRATAEAVETKNARTKRVVFIGGCHMLALFMGFRYCSGK